MTSSDLHERIATLEERIRDLEDEREAIRRLINGAETIVIPSTRSPYTPKMVHASDLEDVLSGKLR